MKKKILIVLCALLIGGSSAYYLFNKIVVKNNDEYVSAKAFQIGAFTKYDNAIKVADRNNGVVIDDKDVYRVYIAILNDKTAINKLENYYKEIGLNYYLKDITVKKEFLTKISLSEEMLKQSSTDTYVAINLEILKKYREML